MGSKKETQTQQTSLPGAGTQEQQMRALLANLASGGAEMFGGGQGLQDLLSGQFNVTPQDEQFVQQISALTNQMQRGQARANFEEMTGAVEGQMLSRGLEGSSIEAVNQALLGRQLQQSLDMGALQNQITSAQQLQQQAQQRAGMQLSANQLLLNQILSGAGAVSQMALQERLAQPSTTMESKRPRNVMGPLGSVLGAGVGFALGGPMGASVGSQLGSGGGFVLPQGYGGQAASTAAPMPGDPNFIGPLQ